MGLDGEEAPRLLRARAVTRVFPYTAVGCLSHHRIPPRTDDNREEDSFAIRVTCSVRNGAFLGGGYRLRAFSFHHELGGA